jgi:hypothetical protein
VDNFNGKDIIYKFDTVFNFDIIYNIRLNDRKLTIGCCGVDRNINILMDEVVGKTTSPSS